MPSAAPFSIGGLIALPFQWRQYCYSPGQLWSQYLTKALQDPYIGSPIFPDVELSTKDGMRAIHVVYETEFDTIEYFFTLLGLPAASVAPVRYFTDSPGFNSSIIVNVNSGDTDISPFVEAWTTRVCDLKKSLLAAWTTAAPSDPSLSSVSSLSGQYQNAISVILVPSELECVCTTDQLSAFYSNSVTGDFGTPHSAAAPVCAAQPSVSVGLDISALSRVGADIASRDVTVSMSPQGPHLNVFGRSSGGE